MTWQNTTTQAVGIAAAINLSSACAPLLFIHPSVLVAALLKLLCWPLLS